MTASAPSPGPASTLTTRDVATTFARHRRQILLSTLAITILTVAVLLLIPARYTALISIVPESRGGVGAGELAGLAALAGVSLPGIGGGPVGQTPQFYASVLTSRPILYAVLNRRYLATGSNGGLAGRDSVELVEILGAQGDTPAMRLWNAAKKLSSHLEVHTDVRTGIVTLTVEHTSPELAASVATAFVEELERFNRNARQSQARARREFTENRVAVASHDLQAAEDSLRAFLLHNRQFEGSPTLRFENERLERALMVQRELYLQLRRELDAARIAEVDDLPAITVVEPAIVPQRRSGPSRRTWLGAVLLLALVAQGGWFVLVDHHGRLAPNLAPALRILAPRLATRLTKTPR